MLLFDVAFSMKVDVVVAAAVADDAGNDSRLWVCM